MATDPKKDEVKDEQLEEASGGITDRNDHLGPSPDDDREYTPRGTMEGPA